MVCGVQLLGFSFLYGVEILG